MPGRRRWLLLCAVFVALRAPLLLITPRLVAEEASVHLAYAMSHGALRNLLLVPTSEYPAGYLNFAANLATTLAANLFPLELAPYVTTAVAFAIQMVPFSIVLWGRSLFWNTPRRRIACCLVLLLSPAVHPSVWLSVLTSQVFCGLIAFLILCEDMDGATPRRRWTYRALLVFCGLTGPYTSMLVPVFFWKLRLKKDRESRVQLGLVLATAVLQLAAYAATVYFFGMAPKRILWVRWAVVSVGAFLFHLLQPIFGHHLIEPLGWRISVPMMKHGEGVPEELLPLLGVGALLALSAFVFYLVRRRRDPYFQLLAWGFLVVSASTTILAYGAPRHRYSVLSGLLLLLLLLVGSWSDEAGFRRSLCRVLVGIALGIGLATYWNPTFYLADGTPIRHYGTEGPEWSKEVARWRAEPSYALRVWPVIPGHAWQTFLPRWDEFREARSALAKAEGFHLAAGRNASECRVPVDGLPADFKVVVRGTSRQSSQQGLLEAVFEDAGGQPLATMPAAPSKARAFTVHFTSFELALTTKRDLGDTRFFVLRLENASPESTAVVSIDSVEIVPRVEGLLDSTLPVKTFPNGLYHASSVRPLAQEATALLALESLLRDGDLRYGAEDAERAGERWSEGPEGLRLRPSESGAPTYREPVPYLLAALPFAALAGPSGAVALNALLFLALVVLAWRDRRDDGAAGGLFVAGVFFGTAALGFVFLPQPQVFQMFCLFVPVLLWIRGRLDGPGRTVCALAGALLATALFEEPAWGLVLLTVAGDLGWRRRWRSLVVLLAAAVVMSVVLGSVSHQLSELGETVAAPQPAEHLSGEEPNAAILAWRLVAARNGLVAGYPFVVLALVLFARGPEDRPRLVLLAVLAFLVNWIVWREASVALESPLGSPHFAALAPLFVLLPRRVGTWHAPAATFLASLFLTLALTSSAWTPL